MWTIYPKINCYFLIDLNKICIVFLIRLTCSIYCNISQYLNQILQYIAISFSLAIPTPSSPIHICSLLTLKYLFRTRFCIIRGLATGITNAEYDCSIINTCTSTKCTTAIVKDLWLTDHGQTDRQLDELLHSMLLHHTTWYFSYIEMGHGCQDSQFWPAAEQSHAMGN